MREKYKAQLALLKSIMKASSRQQFPSSYPKFVTIVSSDGYSSRTKKLKFVITQNNKFDLFIIFYCACCAAVRRGVHPKSGIPILDRQEIRGVNNLWVMSTDQLNEDKIVSRCFPEAEFESSFAASDRQNDLCKFRDGRSNRALCVVHQPVIEERLIEELISFLLSDNCVMQMREVTQWGY